jgi:hypothetical protein
MIAVVIMSGVAAPRDDQQASRTEHGEFSRHGGEEFTADAPLRMEG